MIARRFLVTGRVQGVGFRAFVRRAAGRVDLAGFARNLPDGSVEVVARGTAPALDELESKVRVGPPFGRVSSLEVVEISVEGDFPIPFEIR